MGPTVTTPVQDPLAVLRLKSQQQHQYFTVRGYALTGLEVGVGEPFWDGFYIIGCFVVLVVVGGEWFLYDLQLELGSGLQGRWRLRPTLPGSRVTRRTCRLATLAWQK